MIDKQKARKIVCEYLDNVMNESQSFRCGDDSIVIVDDLTIERPYGWIFFYQSKQCIETGDFRHMLVGNGPIVIEKINGTMHHLGTALPDDREIYDFEVRRFGSSDYQVEQG